MTAIPARRGPSAITIRAMGAAWRIGSWGIGDLIPGHARKQYAHAAGVGDADASGSP